MGVISKQQAREFKERWRLVNHFTAEEVRTTPPAVKLQQLRTIFATSNTLFHNSSDEADEVRDRWVVLKQKANV